MIVVLGGHVEHNAMLESHILDTRSSRPTEQVRTMGFCVHMHMHMGDWVFSTSGSFRDADPTTCPLRIWMRPKL